MIQRWFFLNLLAFFVATTAYAEKEADDLVATVEHNLAPKNVEISYAFKNYRTDGTISEYEVRFEIKDIEHSRGYFMAPQRERGREVLRLKDQLWTYQPTVKSTLRIADKDSFAGGDFSNADLLRVDWTNLYNSKIKKRKKGSDTQWVVELLAKEKDAAYAKMWLWIDKKTTQPIQQHFFDSQGTLLKTCQYADVKNFGVISRPAFLVMKNVITQQKSELRVLGLKAAKNLPDAKFVIDNLGK